MWRQIEKDLVYAFHMQGIEAEQIGGDQEIEIGGQTVYITKLARDMEAISDTRKSVEAHGAMVVDGRDVALARSVHDTDSSVEGFVEVY